MLVSIYLLWIMKESHLFLRTEVNTFPMQEVRAIGLKFAGLLGQFEADFLGIKQTTACFHAQGTEAEDQHAL